MRNIKSSNLNRSNSFKAFSNFAIPLEKTESDKPIMIYKQKLNPFASLDEKEYDSLHPRLPLSLTQLKLYNPNKPIRSQTSYDGNYVPYFKEGPSISKQIFYLQRKTISN